MKIVLRVVFASPAGFQGWATMELKSEFIPSLDIGYAVAPFIGAVRPFSVTLMVDSGDFMVNLGEQRCRTAADCKALAEEFAAHGWNVMD